MTTAFHKLSRYKYFVFKQIYRGLICFKLKYINNSPSPANPILTAFTPFPVGFGGIDEGMVKP
jgi:hypothetical protein